MFDPTIVCPGFFLNCRRESLSSSGTCPSYSDRHDVAVRSLAIVALTSPPWSAWSQFVWMMIFLRAAMFPGIAKSWWRIVFDPTIFSPGCFLNCKSESLSSLSAALVMAVLVWGRFPKTNSQVYGEYPTKKLKVVVVVYGGLHFSTEATSGIVELAFPEVGPTSQDLRNNPVAAELASRRSRQGSLEVSSPTDISNCLV